MSRVTHSWGETVRAGALPFFFAEASFTTVDGIHGSLTTIARLFGFATLAGVVGSTLVNIRRKNARKVFFEFFRLCKIKLLRFGVDSLPFCGEELRNLARPQVWVVCGHFGSTLASKDHESIHRTLGGAIRIDDCSLSAS